VNPVVAVLLGVLTAVCLFVLPFVAGRYVVRRFGGGRDGLRAGAGSAWACPRCGSGDVARLPADRVSPYPGYHCQECGLRMRPRGTGLFYLAVLAACVGLLALFTLPLWAGGEGEPAVFPFILVVAGYSVYQLLRPAPRRRGPSDDGPARRGGLGRPVPADPQAAAAADRSDGIARLPRYPG